MPTQQFECILCLANIGNTLVKNINYKYIIPMQTSTTLLRKKRFELNFLIRRDASKVAIFIEKENPCILSNFEFYLINALVYVDINQEHSYGKTQKLLKMKNEKNKNYVGFLFFINMANFEAFRQIKKLSSNLFFLKSDYLYLYA